MKATTKNFNIYEQVTKTILQAMMRGEIPWRKTWTARPGEKHPFTNHFTGKPYSFLNTLLLGTPGEYATFNQIKEKGGTIRKGAHSKMVIYWGEYIPKEHKEEAEALEKEGKDISHLKVKFPKFYRVFSMDDVEGLKAEEAEAPQEMIAAEAPTAIARMAIDDYATKERVTVEESKDGEPAYDPLTDTVTVPVRQAFTYEEDFYASLFGQLVHSTAAEGRCGRKAAIEDFASGKEMTVKEELIAEIGSSMCLSVAGMKRNETHEQIAAQCQRWIAAMNDDYRLIVTASYGAEKAAKLILGEFAA